MILEMELADLIALRTRFRQLIKEKRAGKQSSFDTWVTKNNKSVFVELAEWLCYDNDNSNDKHQPEASAENVTSDVTNDTERSEAPPVSNVNDSRRTEKVIRTEDETERSGASVSDANATKRRVCRNMLSGNVCDGTGKCKGSAFEHPDICSNAVHHRMDKASRPDCTFWHLRPKTKRVGNDQRGKADSSTQYKGQSSGKTQNKSSYRTSGKTQNKSSYRTNGRLDPKVASLKEKVQLAELHSRLVKAQTVTSNPWRQTYAESFPPLPTPSVNKLASPTQGGKSASIGIGLEVAQALAAMAQQLALLANRV